MILFTVSEAKVLFGDYGKQLFNYASRQGYLLKEYLINGEWQKDSLGNVSSYRFKTFDKRGIDDLSMVWKLLKDRLQESPREPDKVLERLADSRFCSKTINLFSPWGPRYFNQDSKISDYDREIITLLEVNEILKEFEIRGIKFEWLLMPADSYGVEINGLNPNFVDDYFKSLKEQAYRVIGRNMNIIPWSQIKRENVTRYQQIKEEAKKRFLKLVKPGTFERYLEVSRKFRKENAEQNAVSYCLERLAEGELIEEIYKPIKLSLVKKDKDILDGPLKRIYIIKNKAPWLRRDNND